jgi:tetratricopeptide (TPR) repeat protein
MSRIIVPLLFFLLATGAGWTQEADTWLKRFDEALRLGRFEQARQFGRQYLDQGRDEESRGRVKYWLGALEQSYPAARERLEGLLRDSGDDVLAAQAGVRLAEMALVRGQIRDGVEALRWAERRIGGRDANLLRSVQIQLAQAYLAEDRLWQAERMVSRVDEDVAGLDLVDKRRLDFVRTILLWRNGQSREFWKEEAKFEDNYPRSGYLPSLLAEAAGLNALGRSQYDERQIEVMRDILEYYPDSPEAFIAERVMLRPVE